MNEVLCNYKRFFEDQIQESSRRNERKKGRRSEMKKLISDRNKVLESI